MSKYLHSLDAPEVDDLLAQYNQEEEPSNTDTK